MIVAGIDEAGYGPVLGPLVVACCAFSTPDSDSLPCLWTRLSRICAKSRDKRHQKLHINDSKAVYSPSQGLKELERAVLCLIEQAHHRVDRLSEALQQVDPSVLPFLEQCPWYADFPELPFPIQADPTSLQISSNAWRIETDRTQTICKHYTASILTERQFNAMVARTQNKASVSFSLVARHIDDLLKRFADQNLWIVCDRQGGREHYGSVLRTMFPEWSLTIESETPQRAEYGLSHAGRTARIIFSEKAESIALPVAAASMLAKYVRESLMGRFNHYWKLLQPQIAPTAGYYTDGWRFLNEIEPLRKSMRIADVDLIRSR